MVVSGSQKALMAPPGGIMARKKILRIPDKINPPARLLRQYGPLQEMVFCFFRMDYGISSYRVGNPALSPSEAYEVMKVQMADFALTDAELAEYMAKGEGGHVAKKQAALGESPGRFFVAGAGLPRAYHAGDKKHALRPSQLVV